MLRAQPIPVVTCNVNSRVFEICFKKTYSPARNQVLISGTFRLKPSNQVPGVVFGFFALKILPSASHLTISQARLTEYSRFSEKFHLKLYCHAIALPAAAATLLRRSDLLHMRLQLRLTTTAVAFSRSAEAGEYRLFSRRAYKRFAQRTGQRSRRRRSECKRTLHGTFHRIIDSGIGLQKTLPAITGRV